MAISAGWADTLKGTSMIKVSKRFLDRAKPALRRYQKILADARARDVNESDTVVIVSDFLSDVLGYDKYQDVTTEFAIRCTFCDLAIKSDGKLTFLIEVKSIGTDLKDNHVRQAVDYGAKQGCDWVILTNGAEWQAYRIRYEQPITNDLTFSLALLEPSEKSADHLQMLYLISKESSSGKEIDRFWQHRQATSRYVVAQLLLGDVSLGVLRRQLRQLSPGLKVSTDELAELLTTEVLKRDVLEGEKVKAASSFVKRVSRKRARQKASGEVAKDQRISKPVAGPAGSIAQTVASK